MVQDKFLKSLDEEIREEQGEREEIREEQGEREEENKYRSLKYEI